MKLNEITDTPLYETVYVDENNVVLDEAAIRVFKRTGKEITRKFRCIAGRKKGKIVAKPTGCAQRKEPRRIRLGRKVARMRKGVRIRKSRLAQKTSVHRLVRRLNKRFRIKK